MTHEIKLTEKSELEPTKAEKPPVDPTVRWLTDRAGHVIGPGIPPEVYECPFLIRCFGAEGGCR